MSKKRVVIIGAGFAGLSAAREFSRYCHDAEIIVIDKYECTHFRPLIPDVAGGKISAKDIIYPITALKDRYEFSLYYDEVTSIDFEEQRVNMTENSLRFDYLIVATGSQTAFPPHGDFRTFALRLDSVHDAGLVRDAVRSGRYEQIVVCGGGYTGVECASQIRQLTVRENINTKTVIVELNHNLIGTLPVWMQQYVTNNLTTMGIQIECSTKVDNITNHKITLSNGKEYQNSLCVWTTGLVASTLTKNWNIPLEERGRIVVDPTLRFNQTCFAIGDAACFHEKKRCRRMAVQNSLQQGTLAARNTLLLMSGKKPKHFHGFDAGYLIPLANGQSCGELFGYSVKGQLATLLHYAINAGRSRGLLNRGGVTAGAIKSLIRQHFALTVH